MVEVLIYGEINRHFTYRTLIVNIYFFKTFNRKYEQNAYCHEESSVLFLTQPLRGHTLRSIEGHV